MPLIQCPDCHNNISDRVPACHHCGCPLASTDHATSRDPQEQTLYKDSIATITTKKATFLTYGYGTNTITTPISRITRVEEEYHSPNIWGNVFWAVLGGIFFLGGLSALGHDATASFALIIGAIVSTTGIVFACFAKPQCNLIIFTDDSAGRRQFALDSNDRKYIAGLVQVLQHAITIHRSSH